MHEPFACCALLLGLRPSLRRPPLPSHKLRHLVRDWHSLLWLGRTMHADHSIGSGAGGRLPYTAPRCREQVIKREAALGVALRTLHKAGVEGVMIDVWWGIVEHAPGQYDFSAYRRLLQKIADSGLKAQVWRLVANVSSVYGVQVTGVL